MAEIVKQSELLNQTVLDQSSMQEVGQVEVLWMYPKVHRVLGFICKSGWLGKRKTAFNLEQLEAIGSDGVLVNSEPVETDAEKVKQLETLVGCEVWTDSGDQVGKIVDYLFDLETGEIQHYLYISDGLGGIVGSVYLLPPNYILRYGSRRAMVPKESVESFAVYRGGVQERFSKVKDLLSDEKVQVTQEVRSLAEIAREKARRLKEKARSFTEQAYEFVEDIALDETEPYVPPVSEPAPWDDWEDEPPKKQEVKPPQTKKAPAADVWDDDDWA